MKFKFKISDELLTDLVFLSLLGMYFLGLVVIPNIYLATRKDSIQIEETRTN